MIDLSNINDDDEEEVYLFLILYIFSFLYIYIIFILYSFDCADIFWEPADKASGPTILFWYVINIKY